MNQAQRTAALIVRLAGLAVLIIGLLTLVYSVIVLVRVGTLSGFPGQELWSAIIRVLFGLLLIGLGRPIGEWIGRGLE